jgi:IS605 OrfB family transposase
MKTYNIKLEFKSKEDKEHLIQTFLVHQKIWNYLSEYVFKTQIELSSKKIHEKTYHKCRKLFPEAPSQTIIRAREDVISTFKSLRSNGFLKDLKTHPIKENLSIRLDKRLYVLKGNSIKLTTTGKQALCTFAIYPKFQEMMEKYPLCDPLVFVRKNEVWLAMTFNNPCQQLPDNFCIGVDLGIKRTVATSEGLMISDKNYLKHRRKIRYLKRVINAKKRANIKRIKKGNSARKHLQKIRRKEQNISKNYIHHVVNKVLETKASTIIIEDLTGLKDKKKGKKTKSFNNKNSQIQYYIFKTILDYKAQALGKRVETVNPAFTSKDDYRGIERGKRVGCRYYASDGKVFDADLNASINIAKRFEAYSKLPVSFVEPLDGKYKLNGQGVVNHPIVLCS